MNKYILIFTHSKTSHVNAATASRPIVLDKKTDKNKMFSSLFFNFKIQMLFNFLK